MQKTTTKTISTISYNSKEFLQLKLNELKRNEIILFGFFIYHDPEQDEKKGHFHVVMEPNGKVNLKALQEEFLEKDKTGNPKPLGVMPFNITQSYDDWILYSLHDSDYLMSKGLAREHHYQFDEIHCTTDDEELLQDKYNSINHLRYSRDHEIYEAVSKGASNFDLLQSGLIPLSRLGFYLMAIESIRNNTVYRRVPSHTPKEITDENGRTLIVDKNGEIRGHEIGGVNPFKGKTPEQMKLFSDDSGNPFKE